MWRRLLLSFSLAAFTAQGWAYQLPDLGAVATDAFSTQEEEDVGRMVMVQVREREPSYIDDPELEDYLNAVGRKLAEASDQPFRRYRFFVLRDPTINAFALPGGYIGVHSGLILTAESESELAAVLSHEMGHVIHRHIAQLIDKQKTTSAVMLGSMILAILAARSGSQVSEAAAVGGQGLRPCSSSSGSRANSSTTPIAPGSISSPRRGSIRAPRRASSVGCCAKAASTRTTRRYTCVRTR